MPDQPDHAGRAVRPGDVAVGTGAQRRDFTYVSDAVAATVAAATADARAEVVNVTSGRSVPLSDAG
jgi:nucleoside-diphosphate-sugar epimerase